MRLSANEVQENQKHDDGNGDDGQNEALKEGFISALFPLLRVKPKAFSMDRFHGRHQLLIQNPTLTDEKPSNHAPSENRSVKLKFFFAGEHGDKIVEAASFDVTDCFAGQN